MDRELDLAVIAKWYREWRQFWFSSRRWPRGPRVRDVLMPDGGHKRNERPLVPSREEQFTTWAALRDKLKTTTFQVARLCREYGIDNRTLIRVTGGLAIDLNTFKPVVTANTNADQDECWATVKQLQIAVEGQSGNSVPPNPNESRDCWLYEQRQNNELTWRQVLVAFRQCRAANGWQAVDTNGIRLAVTRYATSHHLPLRQGRGGRPKVRK